jgi:hypothetical protein
MRGTTKPDSIQSITRSLTSAQKCAVILGHSRPDRRSRIDLHKSLFSGKSSSHFSGFSHPIKSHAIASRFLANRTTATFRRRSYFPSRSSARKDRCGQQGSKQCSIEFVIDNSDKLLRCKVPIE